MMPENEDLAQARQYHQQLWDAALSQPVSAVLPTAEALRRGRQSLPKSLPYAGLGFKKTSSHLFQDIVPGFNAGSISPNYYGFVTGGTTPAALLADNIVSAHDQNVQVHMNEHSIVTDVEYCTIGLLADLFGLDREIWVNGTFTTGATASNILGLACGREFVLKVAAEKKASQVTSVGEHGMFEVMQAAGVSGLQVLSTMPHSSTGKAAGVLGIGRANMKSVALPGQPLRFDMEKLESELARSDVVSIVAVSCGEVNTGHFATGGPEDFKKIRELCDKYGAWLHVDGAFGIFTRILPDGPEFATVKKGSEGLELADSITGDGHKLLNVPYDCGFFLCRHAKLAEDVFRNPNAAYLSSGGGLDQIPSPLNIGLENSRRFRAFPAYATLLAYGRGGYEDMLKRQIGLARLIAGWIHEHPDYDALPEASSQMSLLDSTFMVVLFKAKNDTLNTSLGRKINETSKIFVSGTVWDGKPACRIAISNWRTEPERDFDLVKSVLDSVSRANKA